MILSLDLKRRLHFLCKIKGFLTFSTSQGGVNIIGRDIQYPIKIGSLSYPNDLCHFHQIGEFKVH